MSDFDRLYENVIKHEGYYANVDGDKGGETYRGVARNLHPKWAGWELIDEYKRINGKIKWNFHIDNDELDEIVKTFYKTTFFDRYKISNIKHFCIKNIVFDWCVNSGGYGAKGVQRVLNQYFHSELEVDGVIGDKTISAINECDYQRLFGRIKQARVLFYQQIAKRGKNGQFLEGWMNRINTFNLEE